MPCEGITMDFGCPESLEFKLLEYERMMENAFLPTTKNTESDTAVTTVLNPFYVATTHFFLTESQLVMQSDEDDDDDDDDDASIIEILSSPDESMVYDEEYANITFTWKNEMYMTQNEMPTDVNCSSDKIIDMTDETSILKFPLFDDDSDADIESEIEKLVAQSEDTPSEEIAVIKSEIDIEASEFELKWAPLSLSPLLALSPTPSMECNKIDKQINTAPAVEPLQPRLTDSLVDIMTNYLSEDSDADIDDDDEDLLIPARKQPPPPRILPKPMDFTEERFSGSSPSNSEASDRFEIRCQFPYRCTNLFNSIEAMIYHMAFFHANAKTFACHLCKRPFAKKQGLQRHLSNVHVNKKEYRCTRDMCKATFDEPCALKRHIIATHSTYKPFKCPKCTRRFRQKSNLVRHMAKTTHTEIKRCHVCKKRYSNDADLQMHMQSKHPIRDFKCTIDGCTREFYKKWELNTHLTKAHGIGAPCPTCHKVFRNHYTLSMHQTGKACKPS